MAHGPGEPWGMHSAASSPTRGWLPRRIQGMGFEHGPGMELPRWETDASSPLLHPLCVPTAWLNILDACLRLRMAATPPRTSARASYRPVSPWPIPTWVRWVTPRGLGTCRPTPVVQPPLAPFFLRLTTTRLQQLPRHDDGRRPIRPIQVGHHHLARLLRPDNTVDSISFCQPY